MEEIDLSELRLIALSLGGQVEKFRERHVVQQLLSSLDKKPRIKLLRGFRGVGKTTAMLQTFVKNRERALYFSADHPIVKSYGLYKTGKMAVKNGYSLLFIDEVHTFPEWRAEIKALHDEFPRLVMIASGSAPLALIPERREELISLHEMDFSEFVLLKSGKRMAAGEEWRDEEKTLEFTARFQEITGLFGAYCRVGGFPFSLEMDEEKAMEGIYNSIRKSIREDAVFFLKMSKEKVFAMENLLNFLATSKPGELSITSLSSVLRISKTVVYEIIDALSAMEIIRVVRPYAGGSAFVRAEPKILFFHPNLRYAICRQLGKKPETGAIREELAVFGFAERGWKVYTIKGGKKSPDYIVEKGEEKLVVEIGGEGKSTAQLKRYEKGLLIRDHQLLILASKSSKV